MDTAGRRETRKRETREALRDAAFSLYTEKGFAAARVADIAAACDVSERTFFRYFDSKERVALAGLQDWLDKLFEAIEELPDTYGPLDAVGAVFRQADAGRFIFGRDQIRDSIAYTTIPEVRQEFILLTDALRVRLIADFARRGGTDELDPYPRVLASVLSSGLFAVMESWLHGGQGEDPWHLARDTMARVANDFASSDFGSGAARTASPAPAKKRATPRPRA